MARRVAAGAAWTMAGTLATLLVLRLVAYDADHVLVLATCFTPYLVVPIALIALAAVLLRRRALGIAAGSLGVIYGLWMVGTNREVVLPVVASRGEIVIFSVNVNGWNHDTGGIVSEIARVNPDVVAVQEYSSPWKAALAEKYPYRVEEVREDASGTAILSRHPLEASDLLQTATFPVARATIVTPAGRVRLYSVHILPPTYRPWVPVWEASLADIERAAREESLPVILAGDFNATQFSRWYARFRAASFHGAHAECGRTLATTWPNGTMLIPPIRLDHVLLSPSLRCAEIHEGEGRGSDHRPVIVRVAIGKS